MSHDISPQQLESVSGELEENEATLAEALDDVSRLKIEIGKLQVGADKGRILWLIFLEGLNFL